MKFRIDTKRKPKPQSALQVAVRPWRVQIIVGLVLAIVIGGMTTAIWYIARIPSLQITSVEVIGGSTIDHETVQTLAEEALTGSYYRIVPHTFAPLYPEARVIERIKTQPRVKEVRLERTNQTLMVAFDEYQPVALWCEAVDAETCLFLDSTGYAFAAAPFLTGSAFIRYVSRGAVPALKQSGFSASFMDTTTRFTERLEAELNLYVTEVVRKDDVDVSYVLAGGAEIKVSERMSADETFNNLQTILTAKDFTALADGSFHYIDLRFGDKVFVSEEAVATSSTTASTTTAQ